MKDFKSTGFVLLRFECPENKMSMLKKITIIKIQMFMIRNGIFQFKNRQFVLKFKCFCLQI